PYTSILSLHDALPISIQQSAAADYEENLRVLESRLAPGPLVLAGLCSGADDAIRLAPKDSRVVGLVLLDPVCAPDDGFNARAFADRKSTRLNSSHQII